LVPPGGGALGLVTPRPYPKMQRATTRRMASPKRASHPAVVNLRSRVGPSARLTDRFDNL
jgi:hypothetical protein